MRPPLLFSWVPARPFRPLIASIAALAVLFSAGRAAHAQGPGDDSSSSVVNDVLVGEYAQQHYAEAKKKLHEQLQRCRGGRCSGRARAQIYIALGMTAAQIGVLDEAKNNFANAISEDPSAKLPSSGKSPTIERLFDEAREAHPKPNPVAAKSSDEGDAPEKGVQPGGKIPGWDNADAFQLASAGLTADLAGHLDQCVENDKKSLDLEDKARTRLHLASCASRSGTLIDALKDSQRALKSGIEQKDVAVMRAARQRIQELLPRIPHVTFEPPEGVSDVTVRFDDREVKGDLTKKFSVDPGKHQVHAEGNGNGNSLVYDEEVEVKEGEVTTVKLTLKSKAPEFLTQGQLSCMLAAKSQEEVLKCLPSNGKNLVVKAGMDIAGYTDSLHVHVFSPSINAQVISPTAGWNVGGSFLADFVTAASPDLVSTASRHYVEHRWAGTLTGGYKPGKYGIQATGAFTTEPDYLGITGGFAVTGDFNDKLITPRFAYSHSDGTIGRNDSPFSNVPLYHPGEKRKMFTNDFELGVTFVLSPTSVMVLGATATTERGDQSKIYRFVPMFSTAVAPKVQPGLSYDAVNLNRLAYRPIEQLPTSRDRYAGAVRFLHRFTGSPASTLRFDQRFYYDTWAIKSSTTDVRFMLDIGEHLRIWPHFRFNAQTGASFYKLAYAAAVRDDGTIVIPTYRTGDRELSPMMTFTGGFGTRIALGSPEASTQYAINLSGDYSYSYFFDSLYVVDRKAIYGSLGFEVEFQ